MLLNVKGASTVEIVDTDAVLVCLALAVLSLPVALCVNGALPLACVRTEGGPMRSERVRRQESLVARGRAKPTVSSDNIFILLVRDFEIMRSSSLVQVRSADRVERRSSEPPAPRTLQPGRRFVKTSYDVIGASFYRELENVSTRFTRHCPIFFTDNFLQFDTIADDGV